MRSFSILILACALGTGCGWFGGDDKPDPGFDGGVGDTCTTNSDCAASFVCAGGTCQLEGSVGLGGSCSATRDCGPELWCDPRGICAPSGPGDVGDPCGTGAECLKGLVCQSYGFGGTCEEAGAADLGDACTGQTDCIAGLACGVDGTCQPPLDAYPPFTGVECEDDQAPFRLYFEVPRAGSPPTEFFRLPFPNDARVDANGNLDISDFPQPGPGSLGIDLVRLYTDALVADFDGFSSVATVYMRFSKEFDFTTLGDNGENVHYIDVTQSAPEYGSDRARVFGYGTGRALYHCQHMLTVRNRPSEPLLPGHTYAVYLTTDIRSTAQEAPTIDADFAAVMGASRPSGELGNAWDQYAPFRDYLADQGIATSTIAGAAVFTVQDTTGRAEALADATLSGPLPQLSNVTLCDGSTTSPCDDGGTRTCGAVDGDFHEIHGRISIPRFQQGTAPYERPEDGGGIGFAGGVPQQQGTVDVCFALTIPKGASMPAGGWPLVVYAHGTGGSFKGAVDNGVARALATASEPMAMLSYDGVCHGERRNGSPRDPDSLVFNVVNPRAARDNHLQGAVDVIQILRLGQLAPFDVAGVGTVSFDASNTYFFGHSQGSNVGVIAEAVSDLTPGSIFSGAGAYLTRGLLDKTSPVNAREGIALLLGEEPNAIGRNHPVFTIVQTYLDSTDTVNYAPLLMRRPPAGVSAQHVWMSWGEGDTFSPNETLNIMGRAIDVPVAAPLLESIDNGTEPRPVSQNITTPDGARTGAMFQYQPVGFDGHFVATRDSNAVTDWLLFLTSQITTGTPTVP